MKIKLNNKKKEVRIKKEDKVLLLIKNLINNKLKILYIRVSKIKKSKKDYRTIKTTKY